MCLQLEANLKITASSVPSYRLEERSERQKDQLHETKEDVQAVPLTRYEYVK